MLPASIFFFRKSVHISKVPRKGPLPDREVNICKRVQAYRELTKLSRVAFAAHVGIDSSELARIEHARVALRYPVGDNIARRFNLNQRWLADGIEPKNSYVEFHSEALPVLPARMLFSVAFDTHLKRDVGFRARLIEAAKGSRTKIEFPYPVGIPSSELYTHNIKQKLEVDLKRLPTHLMTGYHDAVLKAAKDYITINHAYLVPTRKRKK